MIFLFALFVGLVLYWCIAGFWWAREQSDRALVAWLTTLGLLVAAGAWIIWLECT